MNLAITGGTSGIGMETVKSLAPKFKIIFLLVRNEQKADKLIAQWRTEGHLSDYRVIYCDLTDLESVVSAADQIKAQTDHLDVLINNAGSVNQEREVTKDGLEFAFSINHLGHFLLTNQLMSLLLKGSASRIINVSSDAHKVASPDFTDLQSEKSYSPLKVYANVKLFNILFTRSLMERYADKGIYVFTLHPGMISTSFGSGFKGIIKWGMKLIKPLLSSPKKGSKTTVFLATSPSVLKHNGGYFKKCKIATPSKAAESEDLRRLLWQKSVELLNSRGIALN